MHKLGKSLILTAGAVALLFFGCTGDSAVGPALEDAAVGNPIEVFLISNGSATPDHERLSKFFTGRDSFGVALKANVHVAASGEGSGTATHMGAITVDQDLEPDFEDLKLNESRFHFEGAAGSALGGRRDRTGSSLRGRYEGVLEPTDEDDTYTIRGTLWVDGGTVKATHLPAEGRGTIEGTLYPDGSFSYQLDGWLLHHLAEPSE